MADEEVEYARPAVIVHYEPTYQMKPSEETRWVTMPPGILNRGVGQRDALDVSPHDHLRGPHAVG